MPRTYKVFPVYATSHGEKDVSGFWSRCRGTDKADHWCRCSVEASGCSATGNEGHESLANIDLTIRPMQGTLTPVREDIRTKIDLEMSWSWHPQGGNEEKEVLNTHDDPPILRQVRLHGFLFLHFISNRRKDTSKTWYRICFFHHQAGFVDRVNE